MARNDLRINSHGINVADLKAGKWIELTYSDAPNEVVLLLEVEARQATYKGCRSLNVLLWEGGNEWRVSRRHDSTQVTRIVGDLDVTPAREAYTRNA